MVGEKIFCTFGSSPLPHVNTQLYDKYVRKGKRTFEQDSCYAVNCCSSTSTCCSSARICSSFFARTTSWLSASGDGAPVPGKV